jgi:hypothetical protein
VCDAGLMACLVALLVQATSPDAGLASLAVPTVLSFLGGCARQPFVELVAMETATPFFSHILMLAETATDTCDWQALSAALEALAHLAHNPSGARLLAARRDRVVALCRELLRTTNQTPDIKRMVLDCLSVPPPKQKTNKKKR